MKGRRFISQRRVVHVYCEGPTEVNLFSFLKSKYHNKKVAFRGGKDMGGCGDIVTCMREHEKVVTGLGMRPKNQYKNVKLLYIIDNDLPDSSKIERYLKKEDCIVQLCDPNTEGMIMSIIGKPVIKEVGDKDYRYKCKKVFKVHFGCEAHELSESKMIDIFKNIEVVSKYMPELHKLLSCL